MSKEPKLRHGRDKEPEANDPMELRMVPVPSGDPLFMATCLVEEYARLGLDEEAILTLFRQPIYQTHAFYLERGEVWVRELIRSVLARTGRLRVSVTVLHHIGGGDA